MDNNLKELKEKLNNIEDYEFEELISEVYTSHYNLSKLVDEILGNGSKKQMVEVGNYINRINKQNSLIEELNEIISKQKEEIKALNNKLELVNSLDKVDSLIEENNQLIKEIKLRDEKIIDLDKEITSIRKKAIIPEYSYQTKNERLDVDTDVLVDAYNRGVKVSEIAKTVGMSISGVRSRLVKAGVWIEKGPAGKPLDN